MCSPVATVVCPHALPHAQLSSDWSRGWPPLYRTHSTSIISEPPSSPGGATPVSQVRRIEAHRAMPSAVELGVQVAPSYPTPKLFPSDTHPQAGQPAKVRMGAWRRPLLQAGYPATSWSLVGGQVSANLGLRGRVPPGKPGPR